MTAEELQALPLVKGLTPFVGDITGDQAHGELTLYVDPAKIVAVAQHFKARENFERLVTITAVDWYPMEPRFEVVYHFHSIKTNRRVRVKCKLSSENPEIDSIFNVYRGADWFEREAFDMFGIQFRNHPDLKRILMPVDWEGHPLRKDFPIHGYKYSYQNE